MKSRKPYLKVFDLSNKIENDQHGCRKRQVVLALLLISTTVALNYRDIIGSPMFHLGCTSTGHPIEV